MISVLYELQNQCTGRHGEHDETHHPRRDRRHRNHPHRPGARSRPRSHRGLRTVIADVRDPASIAPAIDGADAVLSAVGPRGTGPTTVITDSVRSIIQAMHKTRTRRFLQVSRSIVADEGERPYPRY